ncbi:MAG: MMPL family transporter [Actinomycetota bacterium]|nr:MMPL family transporter [Actinomycetota bacterium]
MLIFIARLASSHPRRIVLVTLVFAVIAGVLGGPVAGVMKAGSDNFEDPASESVAARHVLERAGGASAEPDLIALVAPGAPVRSASGKARVTDMTRQIAADRGVARVVSISNTPDPALVSRNGAATYLAAYFRGSAVDAKDDTATRLNARLGHQAGVKLGGPRLANRQVGDQVSADLARAELLAFPILFLLSLWVFRGLVAAALPPVLGGLSIVGALLGLQIAAQFTDLSIFALNLVTGMGLGLAIDYSLFILSRYREELARVGPGPEAIRRTLATAGRTVAFSSVTVIAALASLLLFPQRFLYSMGVGGMIVACVAALLALVALPAVLAVLGSRVNALAPGRWQHAAEREARADSAGVWYRLSRTVMRRPGAIAVAAATLLVVLGLPFLRVTFTGVDASVLPKSASARQVSDSLAADFPPHRSTPLSVAVAAPRDAGAQVARYAARLRVLPGAAAVSPAQPLDANTWRIEVLSRADSLAPESKQLVSDIRDVRAGLHGRVDGQSARLVDQQASLAEHIPAALALLAVTTLVVLFLMTGSVILPIKALVMNLLTLSAAFGVLVVVFQDGRLEGLLGYSSQGGLESTQPILLFVLAFALSTDYGVFLLTRIKEARDDGAGEREAVAIGLQRTGRIVSAAALLFCVAIGAFATSEIVFIKEVGLGTALAVVIDATLVRALLVPSLMALMGRWNWWAPRPLRRLHDRVGVHEGAA